MRKFDYRRLEEGIYYSQWEETIFEVRLNEEVDDPYFGKMWFYDTFIKNKKYAKEFPFQNLLTWMTGFI